MNGHDLFDPGFGQVRKHEGVEVGVQSVDHAWCDPPGQIAILARVHPPRLRNKALVLPEDARKPRLDVVAATISRTLDREGAEVRARYLGGLGDDRTRNVDEACARGRQRFVLANSARPDRDDAYEPLDHPDDPVIPAGYR